MIIPKLLLLVPLLLLVEAENYESDFLSQRLPLRRPAVSPGFSPEVTVPPVPNTPITQQYVPTVKIEPTTKSPEIVYVSTKPIQKASESLVSSSRLPPKNLPSYASPKYIPSPPAINVPEIKVKEAEFQQPEVTIIFTKNYTSSFSESFSESSDPAVPLKTRQPNQIPIESVNIPISSKIIETAVPPMVPLDRSINLTVSQPDKPSYTIIIVKNEGSKQNPKETYPDVTTLNPTSKPFDTTISSTTYRPTYVPTRVTVTRPSTPPFRVSDPTSTIAPATITSMRPTPPPTPRPIPSSTTTWTPPTVIQTRPTPPPTPRPIPSSTTTWRPPTVIETRPTPPPTPRPIPSSTTTWRPPTVIETRPTPPPTSSTTVWKSTTPQTNIINQLQDYNCRNVNGYYSVANKCDEYIACKNNNAYQYMCPDGLHFDPEAKWPAFPCAFPSEVKCQDQSYTQQPQPTAECPRRYGYFPVPNGDCGHFIVCHEGLATVMPCPPGLAFNVATSTCDWPVNVPSCNPNVFEGFACPATKMDKFGNSEIINFRFKNSCKNYIACHEGRPRLLSCDPGFSFDEQTARCVDSSLIRSCDN